MLEVLVGADGLVLGHEAALGVSSHVWLETILAHTLAHHRVLGVTHLAEHLVGANWEIE